MFVYLKTAHVLVPNKKLAKKTENKVRNIITVISALLVITLFIGIIFLLSAAPLFSTVGKYMTFVPLSIIGLQIFLSIIVMIVKLVKHHKK